MAEQVNIHEAKTHFSRLVERAENGEEIIVARAGRPVATLSAYRAGSKRTGRGAWKGQVWIAEDFDQPDPELEAAFYDGAVFPGDEQP